MSFWEKLKNWRNYLIGWLGGYSVEEVNLIEHIYREKVNEKEKQIDKWISAFDGVVEEKNNLLTVNSEAKKCMDGLRTVQAEIGYPKGMVYGDIKRTSELLPPDVEGWETAGKGLRIVSAEADAFGLSYGQYTAKIRAHTIEDYLRHEGWKKEEWEAVLRKCSQLKRKK